MCVCLCWMLAVWHTIRYIQSYIHDTIWMKLKKMVKWLETVFDTYWSLLIILWIIICFDSYLIFLLRKHGIASYRQECKRKKKLTELSFSKQQEHLNMHKAEFPALPCVVVLLVTSIYMTSFLIGITYLDH